MKIPIPTIHLFERLDRELITLLKSLKPEDWHKSTLAKQWTVKDIAAHLLDGNIRTLSMLRDGYFGTKPEGVNSYQDLVNYLNQLNADWVNSFKRVSPKVLIDLLEKSGKEYVDVLQSLDPSTKALFSVAWAGETESQNWFHIAREYTEKWHHQKQIREAVGVGGLMERELFYPVIDTFMRALPVAYQSIKTNEGDLLRIKVLGENGGTWSIRYSANRWVMDESSQPPVAEVELEAEDAWKLFTKGLPSLEALQRIRISGSRELGQQIVKMIAIMG
ncbi:MAG: maleylpyruvate isomerase family mycothiol-dependent enzyme [Cyclobacteriaceae bacterium]|nr:maleylpyruvate isomerase family mycothiol-dependent enzyme [Cyclobacteriaceae bacterium]